MKTLFLLIPTDFYNNLEKNYGIFITHNFKFFYLFWISGHKTIEAPFYNRSVFKLYNNQNRFKNTHQHRYLLLQVIQF